MPAEWGPHHATYLVCPQNPDPWPDKFEPIPELFAQMAAAIAHFEPVRILVNDATAASAVRAMIANAPTPDRSPPRLDRIDVVAIPTNDSWVRDHGPIFVNRRADLETNARDNSRSQIALDWRFNSWGEKYGRYDLDDVVPRRLGEHYGFEVIEPGIVLEGGSID